MSEINQQISNINQNIAKLNKNISDIESNNKSENTLLTSYPLRPDTLLKMDETNKNLFDVIICGGGTAGCVMAARLTEDPNNKVLLLLYKC